MNPKQFALVSKLLVLPAAQGCSRAAEPSSNTAQPSPMPAGNVPIEKAPEPVQEITAGSATAADGAKSMVSPAPVDNSVQACDLVIAEEMSAIRGRPVIAGAGEHASDRTSCVYRPGKGFGPAVEFSLERGADEAMMTAMGVMREIGPRLTNSSEDFDEQAVAVGPAWMIRRGEGLITLMSSGVSDVRKAAKNIHNTAKTRM